MVRIQSNINLFALSFFLMTLLSCQKGTGSVGVVTPTSNVQTSITASPSSSPSPSPSSSPTPTATPSYELDASWAPEWSSIGAVWHLNGDVNDSSGNGQNGYSAGSISYESGKLNQAAQFPGPAWNEQLHLPASAQSSCTAMTVAFWYNTAASPGQWVSLFSKTDGTNGYGYTLSSAGNTIYVTVTTSAGPSTVTWNSTTVFDGNWHHLAFTLNNGAMANYLDGSLDSSGTYAVGNGFCDTGGLIFAWSGSVSTSFDEIAIWNTALTATEIQTIYNRQVSY